MITWFLFSLANHLWQSTAFATLAGLSRSGLKNNSARARHTIWLAASIKFLLPFSVLIWAGGLAESHAKAALPAEPTRPSRLRFRQIAQPFEPPLSLLPVGSICGLPHTDLSF